MLKFCSWFLIIFLGLANSLGVIGPAYIGCYIDNSVTPAMQTTVSTTLVSRFQCNELCRNYGDGAFKYFGLQGSKCWCGSYEVPTTVLSINYPGFSMYGKAADSECSSVCSGDGAACGASSPLRTSVYSVSKNAVGYMGCYKDLVPHAFLVDKGSDPSQTTNTCSRNCTGYLYYALQGTNCYCGNTNDELNKYGGLAASDSECTTYATPFHEWAGAVNRISVYSVATNGVGYIGCYIDSATRALPAYIGTSLNITSSLCRTACTGYKFSGIEYGGECWCGNGNYQFLGKAPEKECDYRTPSSNEYAGGSWRLSVYRSITCDVFCNGHSNYCYDIGENMERTICNNCGGNTIGDSCDKCAPNYYGSHTNCLACNCYIPGSSSTICEQTTGDCICKPGFSGRDCSQCLPGRYGLNCLQCQNCEHGTCNEGISGTGDCICDIGWDSTLTGKKCDKCSSLRYGPDCSGICQDCGHGNCQDGLFSNGDCSCNVGWITNGTTKCSSCDDGFYDNGSGGCSSCDPSCKTCSGNANHCLSCHGSFLLQGSSCGSTCDPHQYPDESGCQDCDPSCKSCYGGTSSSCTSCDSPLVLNGTTCSTNCPSNYFNNSGICQACHSSCRTCNGPSNSECLTCPDNLNYFETTHSCLSNCPVSFYSDQTKICQSCNTTCYQCRGPSGADCSSCPNGKVLFQGTCNDGCPNGSFNASGSCQGCDVSCETCDGGTSKNCLTCKGNQNYISQTKECVTSCPPKSFSIKINSSYFCQACDTGCDTCDGPSNSTCLSCLFPKVLSNRNCFDECPTGYSDSSRVCQNCHFSCKTCDGADSTNCLNCHAYLNFFSLTNECLDSCPQGFYSNITNSIKSCQQCDSECETCNGYGNRQCLTCINNSTVFSHGSCLESCPIGSFNSSNICIDCNPLCKTCNESDISFCTSCYNNTSEKYLEIGKCVNRCNEFRYPDENGICVDCNCSGFSQSCDSIGHCLNCEGNTFGNSCEKCKDGYWRSDNSQPCQACECNGNSLICGSTNGICSGCTRNTMGDHCELCIDQYFPDPNNPGACIDKQAYGEATASQFPGWLIAVIVVISILAFILIAGGLVYVFIIKKHRAQNKFLQKILSPNKEAADQALSTYELYSRGIQGAPSTIRGGEATMLNTTIGNEISLPGYLKIDYDKDIRVEKSIGAGGAGSIYFGVLLNVELRAKYFFCADSIAVKKVQNIPSLNEEENLGMLHQEVSVLSALSFHPNIAFIVGYSESPKAIITPLYQTDLHKYINNQTIEYDYLTAIQIVKQISFGLQAVHGLSIAHRDIKPPNFLLDANPKLKDERFPFTLKVADFGVCYISHSDIISTQKFTNIFGLSPRYAGPEVYSRMLVKQTEGDIEGLQKSDVYSFAITLWEILSRKAPWESLNPEGIQQAVTSGNRPSLDEINLNGQDQENVKELLIGIMKRCWSQNVHERPHFVDIIKALNIV